MKAGICLHAKNEAPYLAEWIAYHLALGFQHIWIYDNQSEEFHLSLNEEICVAVWMQITLEQ